MMRKTGVTMGLVSAIFGAGVCLGLGIQAQAQRTNRVIEIRKYTAHDGKLGALVKRMGEGEARMFERHGMKNLFHAVVADAPGSQNTYYYVLAHESREAAKKSWDSFRNDPEWKTFRAASEVNGPLVSQAESTFVIPTDFSAVK